MDVTEPPLHHDGPREPFSSPALSVRDAEHLVALQRYWRRYRVFPAMAKLASVLGLSSTGGVFGVIERLTTAGFVSRVERRIAPTVRFFECQLPAGVRARGAACGIESRCEPLVLESYLIHDYSRTSLHLVRDDAMRDAGVFEGDVAVVECNAPALPGDLVLCVVGEELAVRALRMDGTGYFLEATITRDAGARPKDLPQVLGLVVGLVRRTHPSPMTSSASATSLRLPTTRDARMTRLRRGSAAQRLPSGQTDQAS